MIQKSEIDAHSRELGVHAANVQRDYIFGWTLAGVYGQSDLGSELVLKGGNCFRKAYFPLARFSSDLDFSSQHRLSQERLKSELQGICAFIQARTGVVFDVDRTMVEEAGQIDNDKSVVKAKLYFKDFYGKPSEMWISVRLDVTEYDRILLPVQERPLIHAYSDAESCNATIRCFQLEEMLAAKLKCLLQRQHLVDLFDLIHSIFFSQNIEVNRPLVASTFLRKTIFQRSPVMAREVLLKLPLTFAKDVWHKYIVCPAQSLFDFETAQEKFNETIQFLFGEFTGHRMDLAFYPPEYRNLIMEAGRNQTLLRLGYDGRTRLIEPYELSFKVRKDGVGREYLFAYDQTGGRSSNPGSKTFVHDRITLLESTEEKFEPRFEIVTSKAGEFPAQRTFADPNRIPSTRSRTTRRGRVRVFMYTVACPYCGKRFPRERPDTKLNAHKNTFGSQCAGRRGSLV